MRLIAITLTIVLVTTFTAIVKSDDTPKRSPELQVLDRFVGTWDMKVTVKPAGAEGINYDGVSYRKWSQGGQVVVFEEPMPGQEFHMPLTYDPKSKAYPGVAMQGVGRTTVTGAWDEKTLTMHFVLEYENKWTYRGTHRFVDKDHAEVKGKVTNAEGKLAMELTMKQTRRKDADTSATKSRGTIGFSALTLENPFFMHIAETMKAEAKKHGYDLFCVSTDLDVAKQVSQIDDFIAEGFATIVINPCDSKSIGPAIKRANDTGIPVFTNDIQYAGDLGKVICHVGTDNYQGGLLAGKATVDAISESGGKVVILHFPQVEACELRVKGFNEVLAKHNALSDSKKIEVVAALDGGASRGESFSATRDAIQAHPDLAAIFAINDPSALGAYVALERAGKTDQVTIVGFDGQHIGKQAILEGKILCDPVQSPDGIGRATVESIIKFFAGEDIKAEILIPTKLYFKKDAEKDPALKKNVEEQFAN